MKGTSGAGSTRGTQSAEYLCQRKEHRNLNVRCLVPPSGALPTKRNTQLPQAFTSLQRLWRMRVALHQVPQFPDSVVLLAQLNQGKSLLQLGRSGFITAGEIL